MLMENRDAKDPSEMTKQILAIAPILPGQKVNRDFDIPPHVTTSPTHNENNGQQTQQATTPASSGGNDLIDFGASAPNVKAVAAKQNVVSQYRARSVSLMDDDRHGSAMNDKMGSMKLMEPTKTPAPPTNGEERPLERTDTQTSEVDAFFDAEG